MLKVLRGSIFDAKCDLLVVPCNDFGGVTESVANNLAARRLPTQIGTLPYGSVLFRDVHYEFANTVGYAATVEVVRQGQTDGSAVVAVAEQVLRYASANDARSVNFPLLGSGAGGLTEVASFKALEGVLGDSPNIEANVFCLTSEIYENVIASRSIAQPSTNIDHPRVFISYTGYDKVNAAWTKKLTQELRANGVDARMDVFHMRPGFDLPQWMTNEVIQAHKVILVCDQYYAQKADVRKGGVGWETMIIQGDMLTQGANTPKYIAITREEAVEDSLPIYLRSKYALNY